MKNQISFASTIDAIYAMSALRSVINDPTLPGPIGRDEEESLRAVTRRVFHELCAELNAEASGESVNLSCDCHELLQAVLTDRTVAELSLRTPRSDLMRRLRCRLRPRPPKSATGY
ncbi:MAG: hypothetical protein NC301_02530 [Bacteroides sp.]|nr:hypothetical protein [Bacteroides sp.]MCM1379608.1 hypothetical protein [Bacteroides sp.]MCM1446010.1 hypothetical protein [Prevotella sp.]